MTQRFDVAVVGGGIVGLAAAHRLLAAYPSQKLVLLEKEPDLGAHQTGHNSGVIHSGLYYRPGSAKARACVLGAELMKAFCREYGIPFEICGKVVVATEERELPALEELHRRGVANGVPDLAVIGPEKLREIEPHAAGIRALHVPQAGIIDYRAVARKLGSLVGETGGDVRCATRVRAIRGDGDGLVIETTRGPFLARRLISCAGLHSDRVARMEGSDPSARIVPFRGEYYDLDPSRESLVRGLIYPVPDARFPFLGVHFTRRIGGGVEAGPNAVLALAREGYRKGQWNARDLAGILGYPGFWKLAFRFWRTGLDEVIRSYSKRAFVAALQRLVPEVREEDVRKTGSGVRAQALDPSGRLVDDFLIVERPRALHVLNAPSPAATASLAIGDEIARRAGEAFGLAESR
ncbi:MAG TPA: L-2-hydroxyglutarate oxidase [Planctomycetota bacterium]|nr:L-2-hydroxyglutarate oxidase [Planctomycetota bacterium]